MAAEGELVDGGTLTTQVVDTNLMIGQERADCQSMFKQQFSKRAERTLGSGTPRLYRDLPCSNGIDSRGQSRSLT